MVKPSRPHIADRKSGCRHKGKGETLFGLLLALGLAAAATATALQIAQRQSEYRDAQQGAVQVSQAADALRRLVAMAPANPALLPAGVQNGIDWLKPPACGGRAINPAQGFLPCSAGDGFWAPRFQTTVTNVAGRVEARLTFVVPQVYERNRNATVADVLAEYANAQLTALAVNAPAPGVITPGFVTVFSNVRATDNDRVNRLAVMSNPADPDFARVLMSVSNDASTDAYLRTDGANQMRAALNMGGNNLVGANELQAQSGILQQGLTANRVSLRPGVAGAAVGNPCPSAGEVVAAADGTILACSGGRWHGAGTQPVSALGQSCNRPGSYGELISDGTGMICQNGIWIPLQARMGGIIHTASFRVNNGSPVPVPNCAAMGAQPRIFLYPRQWFDGSVTLSQISATPPVISAQPTPTPWRYSVDPPLAGNWRVNIQSDAGGDEAIAMVGCAFV